MYSFELLSELVKLDGEMPVFGSVCGKLYKIQVVVKDGKLILADGGEKIYTVGELRRLIGEYEDMPVFRSDGQELENKVVCRKGCVLDE